MLIREDNSTQQPVYYVSKSLQEAETRYLPLEKAILAIVQAIRKLPHYFQAHTVVVLTQLPLKFILRSANYTSRIVKWGTILGAFDIRYMSRTAVKGQVLADLVAEFAEPTLEGKEVSVLLGADEKMISTISPHEHTWWKTYINGAANQRGLGVGLVLLSPEGITIEKSLKLRKLITPIIYTKFLDIPGNNNQICIKISRWHSMKISPNLNTHCHPQLLSPNTGTNS